MSLASIVLLTLFAGPPPASYEQSQRDLEAATASFADQSPAESIASLEAALASAIQHPRELLANPSAVETLARARLALAWSQLAQGDTAAATATMDLAIRSAGPNPLPLAGLGPDIRKLHNERRAALESAGQATIAIDCDACEVLIDEAKSDNPSRPLLLGTHRVWLLDPHDQLDPSFREVTLDTAAGTLTLDYRPAAVVPDETVSDDPIPQPEQKDKGKDKPKVPRWVKIVGMAVGAGLLVTGGVLLSLDGKCQNGSAATPDNLGTCGKVWTSAAPSYALLGVGGGLLVGTTVWLAVDEARAGQARRASAMVGWTMRF